eukprot:scaffold38343_cov26-Tisochrysis_lutea.AAC.6
MLLPGRRGHRRSPRCHRGARFIRRNIDTHLDRCSIATPLTTGRCTRNIAAPCWARGLLRFNVIARLRLFHCASVAHRPALSYVSTLDVVARRAFLRGR